MIWICGQDQIDHLIDLGWRCRFLVRTRLLKIDPQVPGTRRSHGPKRHLNTLDEFAGHFPLIALKRDGVFKELRFIKMFESVQIDGVPHRIDSGSGRTEQTLNRSAGYCREPTVHRHYCYRFAKYIVPVILEALTVLISGGA